MKTRNTIQVTDKRNRDLVMQVARETYQKITRHLSTYELAIYLALLDHVGTGTSRSEIAIKLKTSRKKVADGIKKLQKIKAIHVDKMGNIELLGA